MSKGHCKCAVAQCINIARKTTNVIYHTFPKDDRLQREWLARCKRADIVNVKTARVCSVHFRPEDYQRDLRNELLGLPSRKKLLRAAVPSLNVPKCCAEENSDASKRKEGSRRKKLRRCDEDGSDNNNDSMDTALHQILVDPQNVVIKEEIAVKQEVESDPFDVGNVNRRQEFGYAVVKEERLEDTGDSTSSAAEESCGQLDHHHEMPLIIKEEIDCDNYIDPYSIPRDVR